MVNPTAKGKGRRRQRQRLYHSLVVAGVGFIFALAIALIQPFYSVNLWVSDQFPAHGSPSSNLVVVGIDDDSLKTYGRWSEWPRNLHAQAINNLSKAGARVIGFDILFAESSPDDPVVAAAMVSANNVVLIGAGTKRVPSIGSGFTYGDFLLPEPLLEQASVGVGHADVVPDPDGKVRRLPLLVMDARGQTYPAFAVVALYTLFHMPLPTEYESKNNTLHLLARDVPVDNSYSLRVNFTASVQDYTYISYKDVIKGNFDSSLVKNKIVLIGMTATGETDAWAVPISADKIPGVFIHAAAMDTILRQRFLTEISLNYTLLIMLLLIAVSAFALPRCGTWHWKDIAKGTSIMIGLLGGYLVASSLAADRGYVPNILYPSLTLAVLYVTNSLCVIVMEQSDKKFIRGLFGRYVSPQISKEIMSLASTGELNLGGEEREVTVLFADIRNFTKLSEQMSPDAIVKMLNTYFSIVVETITQNGGIINKFGGDNVMAIWNAPQSQPEHAWLAVRSAWLVQQKIIELHKGDLNLPSVQFGIGINTGPVLAGNIGSAVRTEYTVIGDAVNLASRICSSTPGGEVWIGPETYSQTKDDLEVQELEPQAFKGKAEPVSVYRVKGWRLAVTHT